MVERGVGWTPEWGWWERGCGGVRLLSRLWDVEVDGLGLSYCSMFLGFYRGLGVSESPDLRCDKELKVTLVTGSDSVTLSLEIVAT